MNRSPLPRCTSTTEPPAVSVVIPVRDGGTLLYRAIESVFAQTFEDWEVIVVDDGSQRPAQSGGDARFARESARFEGQIRWLRTPGVGVSAARNLGVARARGEFIAFLDADDLYLPTALTDMMASMDDDTDMVVAQYTTTSLPSVRPSEKVAKLTGKEAAAECLYQNPRWHCSPWAKLYRKSLLVRGPGFPDGRRFEDLYLLPILMERSRQVAMTNRKVYFYRLHPGSFLHKPQAARADALWATAALEQHFNGGGSESPMARGAAARRFSALCYEAGHLLREGRREKAQPLMEEIARRAPAMLADPRVRMQNKVLARLVLLSPSLAKWALKKKY